MGRFARAARGGGEGRSSWAPALATLLTFVAAVLVGYLLHEGAGGAAAMERAQSVYLSASKAMSSMAGSVASATASPAPPAAAAATTPAVGNATAVAAAATIQGELQVSPDAAFVTFIVPTRGRDTLARTLESLFNQTLPAAWRALVLLDGAPDKPLPKAALEDPRVRLVALEKRLGTENHSGGVRNLAIKLARTPWVAMLDDDDTVHPQYVEQLLWEVQHEPKAEAVLFRMYIRSMNHTVPGIGGGIAIGVGISFAVKRSTCLQGFWFVPGGTEDGELLVRLRDSKRPVLISPHVSYFVKAPPGEAWDAGAGHWVGPTWEQAKWAQMDRKVDGV